MQANFCVQLPSWLIDEIAAVEQPLSSLEQRMSLAIALSAENIRRQTGGPFAALIVDETSGMLMSAGINLVSHSQLSLSHAEVVAIGTLQARLNDWNLAAHGRFQLVTSCEPCAMCFGAIPWSGVSSVVCGAAKADAEAVGFDEGPKPDQWIEALEQRQIAVTTGVLRAKAAKVLQDYANSGGLLYNSGISKDSNPD